MPKHWNVCVNASDEYTDCGGYIIVQYGDAVFMVFHWSVKVTTVLWWQKVQFL